ncbi:MAG TPA: GNAT family N-acetyltransferase [Trueperaceae bacterium]|nr:GNAT family N-acetyltransferase [Trueperaceae bacterium]
MAINVTRPDDSHLAAWNELYAGYVDFYQVEQTPAMRDVVWRWIRDDHEELECFLALGQGGELVGLAHFREFARPLAASRGGYLDDLFVAPAKRDSGAGQALLEAIAGEGRRRGWTVIRWITASDNQPARGLYDKAAQATAWVTYDLAL